MKQKTLEIARRFAESITQWDGIEALTLNEAAGEDPLAPNFAVALDVYHKRPVPCAPAREKSYGKVAVFEPSPRKDRFLSGETPVRVEFKETGAIDRAIEAALAAEGEASDSGTYGFYRLAESEVLFSQNGWLSAAREKLKTFGDAYWEKMRGKYQSKMEHFLSDMGAALFSDDSFYFLISSSGFARMASLTLFCINRRFEPSLRFYSKQLGALKTKPASFSAQIETFLSASPEVTLERKYGIAQAIARGIIAL